MAPQGSQLSTPKFASFSAHHASCTPGGGLWPFGLPNVINLMLGGHSGREPCVVGTLLGLGFSGQVRHLCEDKEEKIYAIVV